ncbi:hypothetical protein BLD44_028475 [Mastigocladus laminosus UU774]|nr:hypothetical protein BLD44_028475 [Mastigocladus laminosus UU774]
MNQFKITTSYSNEEPDKILVVKEGSETALFFLDMIDLVKETGHPVKEYHCGKAFTRVEKLL